MVPKRKTLIGLMASVFLVVAITSASPAHTQQPSFDWRSDWAVQEGLDVAIDSQGFSFPTSIAFVPNPGAAPEDPLYFVTELQGTVKVVTNDRSVLTFAEDFFPLRLEGEVGLAGICLDPEHGYVFVTFAYQDSRNILRNNIVRFESTPQTFSLVPASQVAFTDVFTSARSERSHQIGPCQVEGGLLYVSVADGMQIEQSQRLDSVLGKVLRMTLDGKPAPDNPFYQDNQINKASNYVWAYGLRNPFGLEIFADRVFVADNGPSIDRFLRVEKGANYLWDGSNFSIGAKADAVLFPGKGVAQMEHYPGGSTLFPRRYRDSFFLTVTGAPDQQLVGVVGVWVVPYALDRERLAAVPTPLALYRGQQTQVVAALGFGPDGLYFVPLLPNQDGMTAVLKVSYDLESAYPFTLETESNPTVLMSTFGCFACHTLNNNAGGGAGPVLDREALLPRLEQRLNSEEYDRISMELDLLDREPFVSFRQARQAIRQAQGLEKSRLWLRYRILEPRFDDPNAQMPNLGLTEDQALSIAAFLVETPKAEGSQGFFNRVTDWSDGFLPRPTRANAKRYAAAVLGIGILLGAICAVTLHWTYRRLKASGGRGL